MKNTFMALLVTAGLTSFAAEPKVPVQADVVLASEAAGAVEPSLEKMRTTLQERKQYRSLKKLQGRTLDLVNNRAQSFELPNKKVAEVRLIGVENDVATVTVKVPPTAAVYKLAHDKVLYIQAGRHDKGDLWLLLSQPKR